MLLTTKLVVILLGGGAVIGAVGTRVTSDLIGANVGAAIPTQPCTVIYVPPQPPVKRERLGFNGHLRLWWISLATRVGDA